MQHVDARASGSDLHLVWETIVDRNAPRLWHLAVAAGLPRRAAMEVCELVWLRLSQRLAQFHTLAEVARWLDDQLYRELGARLRRVAPVAGQRADQRGRAAARDTDRAAAPGHDLGAATAVALAPRF
jgi:uncharacterized protein YceH (UPF0502 family)